MRKLIIFLFLGFFISGFSQKNRFQKYQIWQDSVRNKVDTLLIIADISNNPWYEKSNKDIFLNKKKMGMLTEYKFNRFSSFLNGEIQVNEVYRFEHKSINELYIKEYYKTTDSLVKQAADMPCRSCSIRKGKPEGEILVNKQDIGTKYPTINPLFDFAPDHTYRKRGYPYKINFDFDVVYFLNKNTRFFILDKGNQDGTLTFKQVEIVIPYGSF